MVSAAPASDSGKFYVRGDLADQIFLRAHKTVRRYGPLVVKVSSPAKDTMQQPMWQRDSVGMARFIVDWVGALSALSDAVDHAINQVFHGTWWLDRCHPCTPQ